MACWVDKKCLPQGAELTQLGRSAREPYPETAAGHSRRCLGECGEPEELKGDRPGFAGV